MPPYSAAELEERLEEFLDPVLSSRRTAAGIAKTISQLSREQQDFILRWVEIITRSNSEMGYQFAALAPQAFTLMDSEEIESWVIHAMDVYDKEGLYSGSAVFKNVNEYAQGIAQKQHGVALDSVSGILELFLCGLSGRRLKLEAHSETYTDTATLFLPHRIAIAATREENFRAYKATAAHLWAQTRYGTFRQDLTPIVARFPDAHAALRLLHFFETVRLDAIIARDLPGLGAEMLALRTQHTTPDAACAPLFQASARFEHSLALLEKLYGKVTPPHYVYMGELFPERVEAVRLARMQKEKLLLRQALGELADETREKLPAASLSERSDAPPQFHLENTPDEMANEQQSFVLNLDGQQIIPPDHVQNLLNSVVQDLGEIPEEYLVAAGDGGYNAAESEEKKASDVWKGIYHEEGAFIYNEWDFKRKHYRKNWCVLREVDVHPSVEPFVDKTLAKHRGLVVQLRRTFEALRGEDKTLKKQKFGDSVDFDAVIEGFADMRCGMELPDRLFTKLNKVERNMAVMFMVDMSGSTKGWINDAEREALVLLAESLEVLGDRYAIYGFSGMTRKRCELFRVKRFDEPYSDDVKRRIAGITPQDYTRMGVTIRHLTKLLSQVEARTRLLITLSDGKPDDYDGYRGEYGIEDTRQALIEAKRLGIHPFCITIDTEAREYLPHMYGAVNYTVIDEVRKLPLKVADIYRRLTT